MREQIGQTTSASGRWVWYATAFYSLYITVTAVTAAHGVIAGIALFALAPLTALLGPFYLLLGLGQWAPVAVFYSGLILGFGVQALGLSLLDEIESPQGLDAAAAQGAPLSSSHV